MMISNDEAKELAKHLKHSYVSYEYNHLPQFVRRLLDYVEKL